MSAFDSVPLADVPANPPPLPDRPSAPGADDSLWREEFAARCVPLAASVETPYRMASGAPLLLTWDRLSLYHEFIGFSGEDDGDRPESLHDAAILLFLCAHHPVTWSRAAGRFLPLRRDADGFRACVDAWAGAVFSVRVESARDTLALAQAVWDEARAARPIPRPEDGKKKVIS